MAYTQINPATGKKFRLIGAPVVKKDAKALVTGIKGLPDRKSA